MGQPGKRSGGRLDLLDPQSPGPDDLTHLHVEALYKMSNDELNAFLASVVVDADLNAFDDRDAVIDCILSHNLSEN